MTPSAAPIKHYLDAVTLHQQGQREEAALMLARAMGAEEPSKTLVDSLDKLLEEDTMPNDAVLRIIATEVAKNNQ